MKLTKITPRLVFEYLVKEQLEHSTKNGKVAASYAVKNTWIVYNQIIRFVNENKDNIKKHNKYYNFNVEQMLKFKNSIKSYWNNELVVFDINDKWYVTKSPAFHVDVKYISFNIIKHYIHVDSKPITILSER